MIKYRLDLQNRHVLLHRTPPLANHLARQRAVLVPHRERSSTREAPEPDWLQPQIGSGGAGETAYAIARLGVCLGGSAAGDSAVLIGRMAG